MEYNDNESEITANTTATTTTSGELKKDLDKQVLMSIIREWVKNDNDIRELKREENIRKNNNKHLTAKLMTIMRTHNLECFDINDGHILYKKTNVKKPFTKKVLFQLLNEYYKNDVEKANEVNDFLLDNREEVVRERIVRKIVIPK
jgi:hypothetical protein